VARTDELPANSARKKGNKGVALCGCSGGQGIPGGVVWSGVRGKETRARVFKGEAVRCCYVELEAWLPWAASVSGGIVTRRGHGAVPGWSRD
jgi:hypothetical protein